jgi:hypothetical protein
VASFLPWVAHPASSLENRPLTPRRHPYLPIDWPLSHRAAICFLFGLALLLPWTTFAQSSPSSAIPKNSGPYDSASFASELHRLHDFIAKSAGNAKDIDTIRSGLPAAWKVATSESQYEVSSEPLRSLLECPGCDATKRKSQMAEAGVWLDTLAAHVKSYAAPENTGESTARIELDRILQRREFVAARPPSQWDLLRQRFNAWLLGLIRRLFRRIGAHPAGVQLFFWLVLFAVVGCLALLLVRFWIDRARREELQNVGAVSVHVSWQEWIRAARDAAKRGDFREAVHAVYWAGITCLEDEGAITRNRTRTPREHLRLFAETVGAPPASRQLACLAELTAHVERVWYGRSPAGVQDFELCMNQVEELGCRFQ